MDLFYLAFQIVMEFEGGGTPHQVEHDAGSLTCWGISRTHHPALFSGPDKSIPPTREAAMYVYRDEYWGVCRCDDLQPSIALVIFDASINQGPRTAIKILQHAANDNGHDLLLDGRIGEKTISAAKSVREKYLLRDFTTRRIMRYTRTTQFDRFGRGWVRRAVDVTQQAREFFT
jgi:lysozyme family protein